MPPATTTHNYSRNKSSASADKPPNDLTEYMESLIFVYSVPILALTKVAQPMAYDLSYPQPYVPRNERHNAAMN